MNVKETDRTKVCEWKRGWFFASDWMPDIRRRCSAAPALPPSGSYSLASNGEVHSFIASGVSNAGRVSRTMLAMQSRRIQTELSVNCLGSDLERWRVNLIALPISCLV
ncbi:hypothetical protein AGR5A_Cc190195 [Agrobacterium genomosp. 5 str. CFBP 6626]|nr:hypothetical protein AGR5A_Cc190195 [Agrobacterium genomosp. 5 str. CFBP 6626]